MALGLVRYPNGGQRDWWENTAYKVNSQLVSTCFRSTDNSSRKMENRALQLVRHPMEDILSCWNVHTIQASQSLGIAYIRATESHMG